MKRYVSVILFLLFAVGLYAQTTGDPDVPSIGIDTAQQKLREESIERFEIDGYWRSFIAPDHGYTYTRLFKGTPARRDEEHPSGKEPFLDGEGNELNLPDEYVLGTRIDFLHRGHTTITFTPLHPIPIEGITKTVSIWVAGRNYNHQLKLLIEDFFGRPFELYIGTLNFQGWKKLTVAIPPQAEDGKNGIVQRNYHYNNQMGIKITGLRIDCDPMEAYGSYYVYFDDMRAITDLFAEQNIDDDDMVDSW
jgi:hypothetical protein